MRFFIIIFLLCFGGQMQAQGWKKLLQDPIRLEYKVPDNWYVGGFMKGRSCNCTGASLNIAPDRSVSMMILYSDKESIDSLKRQKVWTYSYKSPLSEPEDVSTEHFDFSKDVSVWAEEAETIVLRFSSIIDSQPSNLNYVIYFWGGLDDLAKHESSINKIIESIKPTQRL